MIFLQPPPFHLVKDLNFQRLLIQYKKLVLYRERYQKDNNLDHYQIMWYVSRDGHVMSHVMIHVMSHVISSIEQF